MYFYQILNGVFMFSMASSLSGFWVGAIFGGIEPILGSLSLVVSVDASNVEDNNSCIYSRSFVLDIFFTTQFCVTLEKICLYLRFLSFVAAWVLLEPQW